MKYIFDLSKLKGRMVEKSINQHLLAKMIGVSSTTISAKMNNHVDFTQSEIMRMTEILDIPPQEIRDYFLTLKI